MSRFGEAWRRLRGSGAPEGGQRIVYLCPDSKSPSGGVKVIYQHAQAMCRLGFDAYVMHIRRGFRCTWFEHQARILHWKQLRAGDLAVVPEMMPERAVALHARGIRHALFVQNGYLVTATADFAVAEAAHRHALAVLTISDDTSRVVRELFPAAAARVQRVVYSVDRRKFVPGVKQPLVTYMPRKMPLHARHVTQWLASRHPHWRFQALDGLSEDAVAAALRTSRIFLAFSEYEGLPLPPVEAALAGNVVLGYDGWGGREYWQRPNFHAVPFGDVQAFADGFAVVEALARRDDVDSLLAPGMAELAARYNTDTELTHLRQFAAALALRPIHSRPAVFAPPSP